VCDLCVMNDYQVLYGNYYSTKLEHYKCISRILDVIETKFQRLPKFSRSAIPMELLVKQLDATGSGNPR